MINTQQIENRGWIYTRIQTDDGVQTELTAKRQMDDV